MTTFADLRDVPQHLRRRVNLTSPQSFAQVLSVGRITGEPPTEARGTVADATSRPAGHALPHPATCRPGRASVAARHRSAVWNATDRHRNHTPNYLTGQIFAVGNLNPSPLGYARIRCPTITRRDRPEIALRRSTLFPRGAGRMLAIMHVLSTASCRGPRPSVARKVGAVQWCRSRAPRRKRLVGSTPHTRCERIRLAVIELSETNRHVTCPNSVPG